MIEGTIEDRELRTLMTQYQCADSAALEELVRRISPALLRYFAASRFVRNETEDLLQDCWIRIHRARHTYRSSEPLMPWIFAIARHTRLDEYRRQRRRGARELLVAEVPEQPEPARAEAAGTFADLDRLVAGLPEAQRDVIFMLKVSGMSLEEVARATSSTVGAVKQKAHRAYTALRRALEKDRGDA
jgi:RNA polymerase sigma-70 factor (ECF subfamily)